MAERTLGDKLQSLPRGALYLILILLTSVPLFVNIPVPNKPERPAVDFYKNLMALPEGSTVLVASDWTKSTRGESGGHFDSLMKILARRKINAAIYSTGSPEAPQVARDSIADMSTFFRNKGEPEYKRWEQWVSLGFLPNAEAAGQAIANNFEAAFKTKTDMAPGGTPRNVFESPVLKDKKNLGDFAMVIIVTASKTSTISIERFYGKVPIALMVTGVMVPESAIYYSSGQVTGMAGGLKGLYDLEVLMAHGVNNPKDPKSVQDSNFSDVIPAFEGVDSAGRGTRYFPTLHFALTLLILAVVIGNIGMFLSKRRAR